MTEGVDSGRPYLYSGILRVTTVGSQLPAWESLELFDGRSLKEGYCFPLKISILGVRIVGARGILGVTAVGSQRPASERLTPFDGRNFVLQKICLGGRILGARGIFWVSTVNSRQIDPRLMVWGYFLQ